MSNKPVIVFEGIECSGKSLHINNVCKFLKKKRIPYICLREPGGSKNSEIIRKLILNKKSNFNRNTDLFLYSASRSENIQKLKKIDSFTLLQFNESSTRTRLSFSIAAQKLGINVVESQDSISAKEKGESLIHELETFKSMGIEALVIRTKENNLEEYRNFDEISVISGGFGNTSHPTQALVDVATLTKLNKFSYEVPVTYVGDLKHSRVFSSGRELLTKLGFKVGVFSNEELLPSNLDNLCVFNSWEEVVENSGSVELLRVQKERIENIEGFDFNNYKKNFQLTNEILENTPNDFVVLHPMPINIGIEII